MKLSYLQQGFGSNLPLVLLHPYPLNARFWSNQLSALSKNRHIIAPHFRGYGATRAESRDEFSIASFANDIRDTLATAQVQKAIFAGCSMGGYVLFELWRQDPALISAMVLVDTKAEPDDEVTKNKRRKLIEQVRSVGTVDLPHASAGMLSGVTQETKPGVVRDVQAWAGEPSCETIIKTLELLANRPDSRATMATINVPTLILVGEKDEVTPPEKSLQMGEAIKGSRVEVISNAGHLAPLENPAAVNAAITAFLQDPAIS